MSNTQKIQHRTAEQHYLAAEHALQSARNKQRTSDVMALLALAQVHATLATIREEDSLPAGQNHHQMAHEDHDEISGYGVLGYSPNVFTEPNNKAGEQA